MLIKQPIKSRKLSKMLNLGFFICKNLITKGENYGK